MVIFALCQGAEVSNNLDEFELEGRLAIFVPCPLEQWIGVPSCTQIALMISPALVDPNSLPHVFLAVYLVPNHIDARCHLLLTSVFVAQRRVDGGHEDRTDPAGRA